MKVKIEKDAQRYYAHAHTCSWDEEKAPSLEWGLGESVTAEYSCELALLDAELSISSMVGTTPACMLVSSGLEAYMSTHV